MRVKTVPRQRIIHGYKIVEPVSEIIVEKLERSTKNGRKKGTKDAEDAFDASNDGKGGSSKAKHSDSRDISENKKKEAVNYSTEAVDMTIKHETDSSQKDLLNRRSMAGPSSSEYADLHLKEETKETISNDDNNNILTPRAACCCSLAGPSNIDRSKTCKEESESSVQDDDSPAEAVNLCKKDHQDEDGLTPGGVTDGKLKDTFLYKIMTDPMFLENIQKHKQPRKYPCQFCKQEFLNVDELADHMDVKKDKSNQVICCACKKTFAQKRYLRYHQRCHSERTKYTCDICTKKYTRLDNLTRHNAFHVNPDKFSCSYCEKTFARKDLLNKHLKCHDNKYRFFCEVCHKYFKGPLTLDNHKRIFHSV
ncbi:PREDICTED: zinc finger protein 510-like isoform X2 [Dufourea novaeangliae]|nr:PREDICTED: zinc finger protein 510-like isoform X2 [Dufourea novaeangliae]